EDLSQPVHPDSAALTVRICGQELAGRHRAVDDWSMPSQRIRILICGQRRESPSPEINSGRAICPVARYGDAK
ncbi:MAG: hypothetical protein KDA89_21690, partial [Planctomycetaceae bacterium]|nr:hypothetical protein [Planctomycetaceae bacterium]